MLHIRSFVVRGSESCGNEKKTIAKIQLAALRAIVSRETRCIIFRSLLTSAFQFSNLIFIDLHELQLSGAFVGALPHLSIFRPCNCLTVEIRIVYDINGSRCTRSVRSYLQDNVELYVTPGTPSSFSSSWKNCKTTLLRSSCFDETAPRYLQPIKS